MKKLNIGYDAKRITNNTTGLGTYSRVLVENLAHTAPENNYFLYSVSEGQKRLTQKLSNLSSVAFCYPRHTRFKGLSKAYWRSYGVVNDLIRDNIDLFHGLSAELPFGINKSGIKSIVTIHDLIFVRYPKFYAFIDRQIYWRKHKASCVMADKIIAVSETTKNDIVKFLKIDPEKIEVIYQDCNEIFKHEASKETKQTVKSRLNLPDNYILYLGTIEERKNLMLLAQALPQLSSDVNVVAVGGVTPYADKVQEFVEKAGVADRFRMLSGIPLEDLPAVYQMAQAFVYPSFFEGFGIPIIEALHSKVPVIAATGSCLHEAGGEHSIYVDPKNPQELAQAIQRVLSDEDLRKQMIEEGKCYVEKFDTKKLTEQLLRCYVSVLNS